MEKESLAALAKNCREAAAACVGSNDEMIARLSMSVSPVGVEFVVTMLRQHNDMLRDFGKLFKAIEGLNQNGDSGRPNSTGD